MMNTDIDIVTITRVLADGSHISLGDSSSTIEQIVAVLDAMTEGKEIIDDIFTHRTVTVLDGILQVLPKPPPTSKIPGKNTSQNEINLSNRCLVF